MKAELIDGKRIAAEVRAEVAAGVAEIKERLGVVPRLAVVLVVTLTVLPLPVATLADWPATTVAESPPSGVSTSTTPSDTSTDVPPEPTLTSIHRRAPGTDVDVEVRSFDAHEQEGRDDFEPAAYALG